MRHAEEEIINIGAQQMYLLDQLRDRQLVSLDEIDELVPGFFHFGYADNLNLAFLGKSMREKIEVSQQRLLEMKDHFFETFVHEDTRSSVYPYFKKFYQQSDTTKVCTGFQKIRLSPGSDHYETYLTILKVNKKDRALTGISIKLDDLEPMVRKFEQVMESNEFMRKNFRKFALLTKQETEVLRFISLGVKRSDIADRLCISTHTLDTHRKNIRKKLGVDSTAALVNYARAFDLV